MRACFKSGSLKIQELWIVLGLFLFSLFAFYPYDFNVGHDMASYLAVAKNFVVGNGMIDIQGEISNHRFGYKLLLAGALWLGSHFGGELAAVFYMQMFFCALTSVLAYGIGRVLFDRATALLAYGFFILCPTFVESLTSFGLDGVWPVFVMGSLLCFLKAEKNSLWGWIIVSAALAGLAIWVKEMTGFNYLLIPFLLWAARVTPFRLTHIISFYAVVAVMMWLGLCVVDLLGGTMGQDSGNEHRSFQSALYFAGHYYSDFVPISVLLFILDGLRGYLFSASFSPNIHLFYPVFFMFYGAIFYCLWRAFKGADRANKVLLICIAAYLPYMAWAAQWHMRHVQLVFIIALFGLVIAQFILTIYKLIWKEAAKLQAAQALKAKSYKVLSIILLVGLFSYQYTSSKYVPFYMDDNPFYNKAKSILTGARAVKHKGIEEAEMILSLVDQGQPILLVMENIPEASGINFAVPNDVKTNVGLYHRIMLGVHENPYIPYVKEGEFNDVAFACLRNPITKDGKRYGEIFAFVPSALYRLVNNYQGQSYIYVSAGQDCTPLLIDWIKSDSAAQGFKITAMDIRNTMFRVELGGEYRAVQRNVAHSESLNEYLLRLKANDDFAYAYYTRNYPFLALN